MEPEKPDARRFLTSDTVKSFVAFILSVNDAAKGKRVSDACPVSAAVQSLVEVLDTLSVWVDEIPPATQALRYGNPAFKCASCFQAAQSSAPDSKSHAFLVYAKYYYPEP